MSLPVFNCVATDPKPVPSTGTGVSEVKTRMIEKITLHTGLGSNSKNNEFYDILSSLEHLCALPEGSDFHISRTISERAARIVTYLHQNYPIPLPKLLPEDASSMSLTWDLGPVKRFLTVYDDEVEEMMLHRGNGYSCVQQVSGGDDIDLARVAITLGERPSVSTLAGGIDAS